MLLDLDKAWLVKPVNLLTNSKRVVISTEQRGGCLTRQFQSNTHEAVQLLA